MNVICDLCLCVHLYACVCVHFSVAGGFAWEWAVALLSDSALMRSGNSSAVEGEKSSKKLIPPTTDVGWVNVTNDDKHYT